MIIEPPDPRYTAFIQNAVRRGMVYSLQDNTEFFAECPSEVYDDDLGEPISVFCFWDNPEDARACRQDEWEDYRLTGIDLEMFMEDILSDMDESGALAGIAFDTELFGTEVEPIELLGELLDEIARQERVYDYPSYDELQQYRLQWEQIAKDTPIIH